MPGISGKGLAIAFSGGILLWSGINGKQVSGALKDIIAGKNPGGAGNTSITDPVGTTITAVAATTGPGIGTPAAANEAILRSVAAGYGWSTGAKWTALQAIMTQESGYRNNAQNPTSTAYGMFQFLDTTWATVGGTKTSNAMLQCVYGCKYIKQRYGDPVAAEQFHLANGYYLGGLMSTAPGIILIAGSLTFGNEWYQANDINWRVPIATFGAAWLISGVAEVSDKTAVALSVMALIVACTTPFNGKSVVQEIASVVGSGAGGKTGAQPVRTTAVDTKDAA